MAVRFLLLVLALVALSAAPASAAPKVTRGEMALIPDDTVISGHMTSKVRFTSPRRSVTEMRVSIAVHRPVEVLLLVNGCTVVSPVGCASYPAALSKQRRITLAEPGRTYRLRWRVTLRASEPMSSQMVAVHHVNAMFDSAFWTHWRLNPAERCPACGF